VPIAQPFVLAACAVAATPARARAQGGDEQWQRNLSVLHELCKAYARWQVAARQACYSQLFLAPAPAAGAAAPPAAADSGILGERLTCDCSGERTGRTNRGQRDLHTVSWTRHGRLAWSSGARPPTAPHGQRIAAAAAQYSILTGAPAFTP
jgi:hypothetical protein